MYKRLLVGVALAALGFVSAAAAADLPVRMPVKAPPAPPPFTWTGCYVGGYAGGAWGDRDGARFTDLGQNGLGAAGSTAVPLFQSYAGGATAARLVAMHSWSAKLDGTAIGGGTLGCNWQPAASPFVFGV